MRVIDCHLHLDDRIDGTVASAAKSLSLELEKANVEKALVLHLLVQPWSEESVAAEIAKHSNLFAFINVDPFKSDCCETLSRGISELGFKGLKLHPRLQSFLPNEKPVIELVRFAGELGVPTLIDAFPDGGALMDGFSPLKFAELARACPKSKIIWAHMGGHTAIDMVMLAKRLPNVYMDFSFSLLYYRGSSVPRDLVYGMRSMKFERIFYGSDYPDRSIKETKDASVELLRELGLTDNQLDKVLYQNAVEFGWGED